MTYPQPLAFMRHGETAWNASKRYQGSTETEISNQGQQQCLENSKLLAGLFDQWGVGLEDVRLVTSPLQRARQSAQIIASELGVNSNAIEIENAFREIAMGRWQGFNSAQVKDRFHLERKSRKFNRWEFAPQGGESLAGRAAELQRGDV